ncbi:hypothetical protein [Fusobacterium ulcerans]|uniref:hypothetical protein n=1 Tax=Fusobacterium ulcerans TaxID=861 RepID=UPI0030AC871D
MTKKILFIGYNFFGYEKIICNLIEKVLKYKVIYINVLEEEYKYRNKLEKIFNNFIYKPILRKNIKVEKFNKRMIELIENNNFDIIFCIRPDKLNHCIMKYLKEKNKKMIAHHWDSISFIKKQKDFLEYFDIKSTFDKKESIEYDMKFIPNFYIKENIAKTLNEEYDFFTVMKLDKRVFKLEKLARKLQEKNKKYLFIVVKEDGKMDDFKSDLLIISNKKISLEKNYEYIAKSKGIVEIGHERDEEGNFQGGLSFRIADAIGNRKKIITNYSFIKEYDFYNEQNIFVIENENYELDDKFLNLEYKDIDIKIYEEYSDERWIKKIFNEI